MNCLYCNHKKINKHMCWNKHCSDFAVIRLLVETTTEVPCDKCDNLVDPTNMLCCNEKCMSYGDREDDYYEEDELIEELLEEDTD